jgi:hypothetical protein
MKYMITLVVLLSVGIVQAAPKVPVNMYVMSKCPYAAQYVQFDVLRVSL